VRTLLLALALFAVAAFLPRLLRRFRRPQPAWIDADRLMHEFERGHGSVVIDVRGADEFNGPLGRIPRACNVPLADMAARLAELQGWKARGLTLVCRTDKRSAKAAELLAHAGFTNVRILRGGMEAWNRRGFPTARESRPQAKGVENREDAVHPQ
jgi:rhodanese-related sulfurtransferase